MDPVVLQMMRQQMLLTQGMMDFMTRSSQASVPECQGRNYQLVSGVLVPVPDSDEELDHAQVQSALLHHLQCTDDPIFQFSSPGGNKREPSEHNRCDLSSNAFLEQQCNLQPDVESAQANEGEPLGSSGPDGVPHTLAETPVVSKQ